VKSLGGRFYTDWTLPSALLARTSTAHLRSHSCVTRIPENDILTALLLRLCAVLHELLRSDCILLTDTTNAIHKNKDRSEAVLEKKGVHQYNVEFLILQLIASGLIECIDKKEKDGYKSYVTLAWSEEDRVASMYQASKWDLIETT
jgi:hypothetical protein